MRCTHLDAIVAFLVDNRNIGPSHALDNLNHGLYLVVVGGNGAWEILKALLVAQLRAGWEIWDLQKIDAQANFDENYSIIATTKLRNKKWAAVAVDWSWQKKNGVLCTFERSQSMLKEGNEKTFCFGAISLRKLQILLIQNLNKAISLLSKTD